MAGTDSLVQEAKKHIMTSNDDRSLEPRPQGP